MSGAGKGDTYRKVDGSKYRDNHDKIFKKGKGKGKEGEKKPSKN